jgi:hypothetical protein
MKKQNLKNLNLKKSSISKLTSVTGGNVGQTCEGPCQGGTECCVPGGSGQACSIIDPTSASFYIGVCVCPIEV